MRMQDDPQYRSTLTQIHPLSRHSVLYSHSSEAHPPVHLLNATSSIPPYPQRQSPILAVVARSSLADVLKSVAACLTATPQCRSKPQSAIRQSVLAAA